MVRNDDRSALGWNVTLTIESDSGNSLRKEVDKIDDTRVKRIMGNRNMRWRSFGIHSTIITR